MCCMFVGIAQGQEIDLRDVYNSLPTPNHSTIIDGITQLIPQTVSRGIAAVLVHLPQKPIAPNMTDFKIIETISTQKSDNMVTFLWRDPKDIKMSHKESTTQKYDHVSYTQAYQTYKAQLEIYNKLLKLIDAIQTNISSLTFKNLNVIHKLNKSLEIARKKIEEEYFFNNAVYTARLKLNEVLDEQKSETSLEGTDKWQFRYRTIGLLGALVMLSSCYCASKSSISDYSPNIFLLTAGCATGIGAIIWSLYNSMYHNWYYQHRVDKSVQNYTMLKEFNEFEFDQEHENPISVSAPAQAGN